MVGSSTFTSLTKILQQKRHVKASYWDPSKLTHFDEDSSSYARQNTGDEMCQFSRIPMTRLNVSFLLQNFSQRVNF